MNFIVLCNKLITPQLFKNLNNYSSNMMETVDDRQLKETEEVFKVLADNTRLEILLTIAEEEKCVHEIADATNQSVSNVSHHLRRLKDKGLIGYHKEGRHKFYKLMDDHIIKILQEGIDYGRE